MDNYNMDRKENTELNYSFGYIYKISNNVNDKVYIGLTTRDIHKRFSEHCVADSLIGRAIRKHGIKSFRVEVIDRASNKNELCQKERYWIKEYGSFKNGYNNTNGGEGIDKVVYIENKYTDLQVKFLKQCDKERHDSIDVHDPYKMVRMCLIYTLEAFLISNNDRDKKMSADMILKLEPNYLKAVLQSKVITKNELKQWV